MYEHDNILIIDEDKNDSIEEGYKDSEEIELSIFTDSIYMTQIDVWKKETLLNLINNTKGDEVELDSTVVLTNRQFKDLLHFVKEFRK